MEENYVQSKIENWNVGEEVCFNIGTGIISGVVNNNILCQSEDEVWRQISLQIGNYELKIDSRDIKEVYNAIRYCEDGLLCKDYCEDFGIEKGLTDSEFLSRVIQYWHLYSDKEKEELAIRIAKSVTGENMVDLFTAYRKMRDNLEEYSQKVIDLLEEQFEETNKKKQVQKKYEEMKKEVPEWTGLCFDGILKMLGIDYI